MKYSICIRTLGTSGEKYIKLIKSIEKLKNKPSEIIIVVAKGYSPPKYQIGIEKIVYSEKGMLEQRIVGYENATCDYVLLLDDDVAFDENLVNELYKPIREGIADITFPIYKDLLPQSGIRKFISILMLSSIPKKFKDTYIKMLPSGGYMYNNNLSNSQKFLKAESGPGMCVFGKREAFINIDLRKEKWCEIPRYALRDDTVLTYKAHLYGYKIIAIKDVNIEHLDAGSSNLNRRNDAIYGLAFNQIVMWYRLIYRYKNNKLISIISIFYWIVSNSIYLMIMNIVKRQFTVKVFINGIINGIKYIYGKKEVEIYE